MEINPQPCPIRTMLSHCAIWPGPTTVFVALRQTSFCRSISKQESLTQLNTPEGWPVESRPGTSRCGPWQCQRPRRCSSRNALWLSDGAPPKARGSSVLDRNPGAGFTCAPAECCLTCPGPLFEPANVYLDPESNMHFIQCNSYLCVICKFLSVIAVHVKT